ncbi:MAG: cobalamin adenosyltransferase [Cellulosilyticaceae bacterium]
MALLTESEIRRRLNKEDLKTNKEIYVSKQDIVTPSAKSLLSEKKIALRYIEDMQDKSVVPENTTKEKVVQTVPDTQVEMKQETIETPKNYKYTTVFGARLQEKPEHMTHLNGNLLVFKDHHRITFRGKIDSLESKILETQILCQKNEMPKLVSDLQEILEFVRNILKCEVIGEKMENFTLQGLTEAELRERSHHPSKYFGMNHFFPDYTMGEVVIALNSLRSLTRETELVAYNAFKGEYGDVEREDLMKALNRLSSLFWIMMFKVRTDEYK